MHVCVCVRARQFSTLIKHRRQVIVFNFKTYAPGRARVCLSVCLSICICIYVCVSVSVCFSYCVKHRNTHTETKREVVLCRHVLTTAWKVKGKSFHIYIATWRISCYRLCSELTLPGIKYQPYKHHRSKKQKKVYLVEKGLKLTLLIQELLCFLRENISLCYLL